MRKPLLGVVVSICCAWLAGCGGSGDELRRDLAVATVINASLGFGFGNWPAGFYEARDSAQWRIVWRQGFTDSPQVPVEPTLNFGAVLVAGVSVAAGSVCDSLVVVGAVEEPDVVRVTYRVTRPTREGFCARPPTGPIMLFVSIEAVAKPLLFVAATD